MNVKMRHISLTGHIGAMNHTVSRYLSRYDIQLTAAARGQMQPFTSLNPYAATLRMAEHFAGIAGDAPLLYTPMPAAAAVNMVQAATIAYDERSDKLRALEQQLADVKLHIYNVGFFTGLATDLAALANMTLLHHRAGKMPIAQYKRFETFLGGDVKFAFFPAKRDKEQVYGIYITPIAEKEHTDALFSSLDFAQMSLPRHAGTPAEVEKLLERQAAELETEVRMLTSQQLSGVADPQQLAIACDKVRRLYAAFDVKKYAAISRGRRVFSFQGWMSQADTTRLEAEAAHDDRIIFTHSDNAQAPTRLHNLPVIRQFEFFTRMYGLPKYGETDPTPIMAVTYTLLFGLMFGDVGHGLVLAFLGLLVARRYQPQLGGIMTTVGISAAFFGVLYGSAFGFEWQPLWRRPADDITGTLIFAAALGAGLIAMGMLINIWNCWRGGRISDMLFGANGVAGLLFYAAAVWLAVRLLFLGMPLTAPAIALAALPLVVIVMKHPLENAVKPLPRARFRPASFIFRTAIELFETLLTYTTNTISFVRVGAFAVSHAGMMHVVLQLSQGAHASRNWLIIIVGNVLVMGIEGLLIGIQALRLDFYEIFSRFYSGTGRGFQKTYGDEVLGKSN